MTLRAAVAALEISARNLGVELSDMVHFSYASKLFRSGYFRRLTTAVLALEIAAEEGDDWTLVFDGHSNKNKDRNLDDY